MTKLHKHYIIGLSLLLACSATAAPDLSNFNHGVVYDAMRDLHEVRTQDMHEYDSVRCTPPVAWPSVVHPFNFSPETFTSLPDANPAEGVELLSMPYSNSQGDLLLSYDLFLPAAHHDLKAILPVSYNSGRKNGNIAAGWNLDIPQIEMDTLSHGNVNGYESFMLNGRRIVYSGRVQGDTAMVYYYQFHHTTETILRIQTGSGFENCRWELKDGKGVTYRFGSYDKDGKLKDVVRSSLGRVLAWRLCAMENDHKDYVRYQYGEKISDDDSIFVGNPNQDPHTCIVLCGVAQLRKWQDETLSQKMLNKIFVLQAKEFPKGDEKWAHVHDYEFARYKGNLVSFASWGYRQKNGQAIKEDAYHHRFDYYDDVERVAQSRRFRNLHHNISLDSLIVDRTGLLKTAHTPLGGCFTVNYAYSAVPDTLGRKENAAPKIYTNAAPYLYSRAQFIQKVQDSIQASDAYKTSMILRTADLLDSLFREGVEIASIPFDTLVQWYFDYTDCHKGKRVVTSLWVNDGINSDGEPSRNDYLYERPFCDSLGHFRGFGKVTTLHYNTVTNSCERQRVKHYDTTDVALLGQIRSCELRNNVGDELLQQTEYEWNLDGTPFNSIYCIRLKNRAVSIGDYTYTFAYQYEGGNLSKVLYGNGESLSYSYVKKDENHILPKGMVAEGEGYRFSYALEYEANPPYRLTQITEGENETTFAYDKDGNISEIKFPADGNGESEVCTYRYDRRFNMFLDRVENNLGYRTELEDYNYPYGKPSTLIDQNGFVMRQSFDGYGRLDTLVAPNEIDNKIPYSIVIDHRFIQNFRKEEEIIEGPLFEDSLRLHIPPFVRNGEIEEDVKTKIDSLLATFVLPRRGAKGHIEISISDTVTTPRTICTTSSFGEEDTLFIVGYDTIQLDTCRCHDRYTPASAATLRYNALYNQWNDRKAKDSTIVVYTFIDGFGKKTQRIRKTELTDVDVNNGKFNGKSARWVTTEAQRHDPFGRTTALYPPQLHQGNLGTIGDMDKNIYIVPADTLLSYDGLDRLSSMTIGNHDFSYDYRSDANDGFIRTRVEKYDETRRDTLDIIAYNYRNQLLRKEVMNANTRRSDWNVLYFIDRERYAYNLIGKITHSLTAYDKVDYAYDKAGRLISESSARHGNSTFTYDKAGNLIQEKKADGETIQYSYRNNLLSGIAYTLHPENNVSFFYGDKNATHNRVGRLALMVDETGAQEFFYGRHGETMKVRRTMVIPNQSIETYVTQFKYDTWNRLAEVIYPDGEMVKYRYDNAGRVEHVWGEKSYGYNYVDHIGYDLRGNKSSFEYCNGDVTLLSDNGELFSASVLNKREQPKESLRLKSHEDLWYRVDTLLCPNFSLVKSFHFNNSQKENHSYLVAQLGGVDTSLYVESYKAFDDSARLYSEMDRYASQNVWTVGDTSMEVRYRYHYGMPYLPDYKQAIINGEGLLSTHFYAYDPNGNCTEDRELNLPSPLPNPIPQGGRSFLRMDYTPEGNLAALDDNGHLETYWYDGNGHLSFRLSAPQNSLFVNGKMALQSVGVEETCLSVNPYFERVGNSVWVKHVFVEKDRLPWVSKVTDNASYGADARRIERAGLDKVNYQELWGRAYANLLQRHQRMETTYTDTLRNYPTTIQLRSANVDRNNDNYESKQFYYHYDKAGNLILATDLSGKLYQLPVYLQEDKILFNRVDGEMDLLKQQIFSNDKQRTK